VQLGTDAASVLVNDAALQHTKKRVGFDFRFYGQRAALPEWMPLKRIVPSAPSLPETRVFLCVGRETSITRTLRAPQEG
jgi:hypothetical protein